MHTRFSRQRTTPVEPQLEPNIAAVASTSTHSPLFRSKLRKRHDHRRPAIAHRLTGPAIVANLGHLQRSPLVRIPRLRSTNQLPTVTRRLPDCRAGLNCGSRKLLSFIVNSRLIPARLPFELVIDDQAATCIRECARSGSWLQLSFLTSTRNVWATPPTKVVRSDCGTAQDAGPAGHSGGLNLWFSLAFEHRRIRAAYDQR